MFKSLSNLKNVTSTDHIKRALQLRKLVYENGIDWELNELERFFFIYYSKTIGEIWSQASLEDQKNYISHSAKFLV